MTDEGGQAERLAGALRLLAGARERLRLRGIATYSWRDSVGPGWMAHAGLRRLDNSPKPALFAVRDAIAELRRGEARPEPPGAGPQRVDERPPAASRSGSARGRSGPGRGSGPAWPCG